MRASLRVRVVRAASGGYVEIHDLVVETEHTDERDALEMFKARASIHPVVMVPNDRGSAVISFVRNL